MSHVPYLVAGYGVTALAIGAYAAWVTRRYRAVSRSQSVTEASVSTVAGPAISDLAE